MQKGKKAIFYDILSSLLVSVLSKLILQFINSKTINLNFIFKNSFYFLWSIIFLIILFLHISVPLISRKIIDKKQKEGIPFTVIQNYDDSVKIDYSGFKWEVFFNFPSSVGEYFNLNKNYDLNILKDVYFGEVEGPYCPNDKRQVNVSRTTFGFYKYKCPKCGYKKKSYKNLYTFREETLDEIRSKYR